MLQAFLQRIINAGGRVEREYGLGRMRTDILIVRRHKTGEQRVVIELKIKYDSLEKTISDGIRHTWKYMDRCGAEQGHLVIFDRGDSTSWDEKIFRKQEKFNNSQITVWGM